MIQMNMENHGPIITDGDKMLLAIHRSRQKKSLGQNPLVFPRVEYKSPDNELPPHSKSSEEMLWEKVNSKPFLAGALKSQYGTEARNEAVKYYKKSSDNKSRLIDEVLDARSQQRAQLQDRHAAKIRELNAERAHLHDEREKVRKQRLLMDLHPPSSVRSSLAQSTHGSIAASPSSNMWGSSDTDLQDRLRLESSTSLHGVESFINITNTMLPAQIAKFNRHQAEYQREMNRLHRPYNGELGPQSFQPWQMEHYYMVRSIVEDLVENFLDSHFRSSHPALDVNTAQALIQAESREWEQRRLALREQKVTQLVMEEIVLETTSTLASEIANEFLEVWDLVKAKTNSSFMLTAEQQATNTEEGRDPSDPAYNLITKTYFNLQKDRQKHRSSIWHHTQHVHMHGPSEQTEKK